MDTKTTPYGDIFDYVERKENFHRAKIDARRYVVFTLSNYEYNNVKYENFFDFKKKEGNISTFFT